MYAACHSIQSFSGAASIVSRWQVQHGSAGRRSGSVAESLHSGAWNQTCPYSPEAGGVAVHELRDDLLASLVELFGLEIETLDRASERIAKQFHFRLSVAFT